jgi:Caspase domain
MGSRARYRRSVAIGLAAIGAFGRVGVGDDAGRDVSLRLGLDLGVDVSIGLAISTARADGPHRFAIIVGNDQGGRDTRPLLYATEDARKIWEILTRLGSVRSDDTVLLLDADARRFSNALGDMEVRARAAGLRGEKTTLIIYYSGHAKDGSLRLGDSLVPLAPLKARLAGAPFDVRIGIFDSCQSGAPTRTKGARHAPAFEIDTRSDREARGTVILTSSASDEDSQESDQIGGSYFSHHLTSGLLGGADKSGDGRVTLSEAYAYAYDRTVADTADSAAGTQHPTFSYDLAGNGDLVLTDVVTRREGLLIPGEAPPGTYFLIDTKGYVAAEIIKVGGAARRIALAPGHYRIKRRLADRLRIGEVDIPPGQLVALVEPLLRDVPFSDDPVKGAIREPQAIARWSVGLGAGYQSVFAAPSAGLFPAAGMIGLDFALRDFFRRDWVWGFDVAAGGTHAEVALPTVVLPYRFSELSIASSLLSEWRRPAFGRLIPFIGARVALLVMSRKFDDQALPDQFFATLSPGLTAGARFRLGDAWAVVLRGRLHYLLYNVDATNRSMGYFEVATFLQFDFGGST